mgnify:FL=1
MSKIVNGLLLAALLPACIPLNEDVVGRFALDEGAGCNVCAERGPRVMSFREVEAGQGAFRYRFDFEDGGSHAGAYQFVATDSSDVSLTLYPDSAGPFYQDVVGQVILTQYTYRAGVMREPCGGLFKLCKWKP